MTDRDAFDRDDELRAQLRAADPARSLRSSNPAEASRLVEVAMSADQDIAHRRSGRSRLSLLVAAAALVVAGGAGLWSATGSDSDSSGPVATATTGTTGPTGTSGASLSPSPAPPLSQEPHAAATAPSGPTVLRSPAVVTAKCMVPNAQVLGMQGIAFQGTVTGVDGGVVTLDTERVFTGEVADQVLVQAPSQEMSLLLSAVQFENGKNYLVSATDGQVTLCGFSAETTPELLALYEGAFGG